MDYLKEMEYQYCKDSFLKSCNPIYSWLMKKIEQNQTSNFTTLLKNLFSDLNKFLEANDRSIKELQKPKNAKIKKGKQPNSFKYRYEKYFSLFENLKKEKFRRKWNNFQSAKWWELY